LKELNVRIFTLGQIREAGIHFENEHRESLNCH